MSAARYTASLTSRISRRNVLWHAVLACLGLVVQSCAPPNASYQPALWLVPRKPVSLPDPTSTAEPTFTPAATPTATPEPTATATAAPTATPVPTLPAPDPEFIRPIGKNYPLPPDFRPSELRTLLAYPFIRVTPGKEALLGHPVAVAWLSRLFEAAREAGITNLSVRSAYRSMATQAYLWENAGGKSQSRVASPGTSEHHSGLAFDFCTAPSRFSQSPADLWLRDHAHRFGFVCTYPRPGIDGISQESWHYRYVGMQTSTQMAEWNYLDPNSTLNPIEFYAGLMEKSRPQH